MHSILLNGRFLTQPRTGVQQYAESVVRNLDAMLTAGEIDRERFRLKLVRPRGSARPLDLAAIETVAAGRARGHLWEQTELPRLAAGHTLFCGGNAAPVWRLPTQRGLVLTLHDLSPRYWSRAYGRRYRLLHRLLTDILLPRADAVITVSEAERGRILEYFPGLAERLVAVPNGVDVPPDEPVPLAAEDQERLAALADRPFVLYVGSLTELKNFAGLARAWTRVRAEHDLALVAVGGRAAAFSGAAFGLEPAVRDAVTWFGQVDSPALLSALYRETALLVLPSFSESFGLPALEGLAHDCPVAASRLPAVEEVCGDCVEYFDPARDEDIARAMVTVLGDDGLRERRRRAGLERARQLSWQECARRTWRVIERVAER